VLPANPNHRPSQAAVRRVERELTHRESKMQAEIIEIAPLMVYVSPCLSVVDLSQNISRFAKAEPTFGRPFRADIYNRIIHANQIMLGKYQPSFVLYGTPYIIRIDRLKEARGAIGVEPFDPFILENMVAVLSPYRRRHSRTAKTGLYLCAASLLNKTPLPHDSVLTNHLLNDFSRKPNLPFECTGPDVLCFF
jgi:hypothetical protein